MARGLLSDRSELEVLFEELAEELARLSSSTEVVMVGGCALVLVDDNGRLADSTKSIAESRALELHIPTHQEGQRNADADVDDP